eukprot:SAG31_NODE_9228_length_1313_cov_0.916804_1_plen_269_part_00
MQGACTVDCGSQSRIVCDTPKFQTGQSWAPLNLKVGVQKASTDEHELPTSFTCVQPQHSALAPTVLGVTPRHASANWAVNITGSRFGSNIKDYRTVFIGSGRPPSGGNIQGSQGENRTVPGSATHAICRPQSLNRGVKPGEEKQVHTQVVMQEDYSTLGIWEDFFRCELGDFPAGSYTTSVHLPYGLAWANPNSPGAFSSARVRPQGLTNWWGRQGGVRSEKKNSKQGDIQGAELDRPGSQAGSPIGGQTYRDRCRRFVRLQTVLLLC